MVGTQVSKNDLNFQAGEITSWLNEYFNRAIEVKNFLDGVGHVGLLELGFTSGEADILISAFGDLETSKTQFDTSAFVKQLYGLGIR